MTRPPLPLMGGCQCGAVRYAAQGAPAYVPYCHCRSCRKATGAPVVAFVVFEADRVRFTRGRRAFHESSPGVKRAFCRDCGTPLSYEAEWGGRTVVELYVGTLDAPERVTPDRHVFVDHRLAWFDVHDALPRYGGTSAGTRPDAVGPVGSPTTG